MITNAPSVAESLLIEKYESEVMGYVDDVLEGRLVTGKLEQAMCQRYIDDLKEDGHKFWFDKRKAAMACNFYPQLRHTQGSYRGERFNLYPIQAFWVWNIFGWQRMETNFRRFREVYISLGRGNGKTPFGAATGIKISAFDTPPFHRAECYLTATKRDQAKIAFGDFGAYVASSGLDNDIDVLTNEIRIKSTGSTIKPLPADGKTSDGMRIYFVLRDEVHAFTEHHRNYYNQIETGLGKFDQDLAMTITTAGDDESLLWIEQDNIAQQTVERDNPFCMDQLFVCICRIDEEDDPFDIDLYPKANPLMRHGVVKREKIEKLIDEAKLIPSKKRALVRYYGNRRVDSGAKAFTQEMLNRSRGEAPSTADITPHAGLDMGQTDDLAAVAYCWRLPEVETTDSEGKTTLAHQYVFHVGIFCARANPQLKKEPFVSWVDSGQLEVTESEWTDPDAIYANVEYHVKKHGVATIAMDPNNTRTMALHVLENMGIEPYMFLQTPAKYNEPMKELKRAMLEGRVFLPDNPLLEWCFHNVIERTNQQGHSMPDKRTSTGKIDPVVALLMAFSESNFAPKQKVSVYETRGAFTIG